jgi:hypothetical protein
MNCFHIFTLQKARYKPSATFGGIREAGRGAPWRQCGTQTLGDVVSSCFCRSFSSLEQVWHVIVVFCLVEENHIKLTSVPCVACLNMSQAHKRGPRSLSFPPESCRWFSDCLSTYCISHPHFPSFPRPPPQAQFNSPAANCIRFVMHTCPFWVWWIFKRLFFAAFSWSWHIMFQHDDQMIHHPVCSRDMRSGLQGRHGRGSSLRRHRRVVSPHCPQMFEFPHALLVSQIRVLLFFMCCMLMFFLLHISRTTAHHSRSFVIPFFSASNSCTWLIPNHHATVHDHESLMRGFMSMWKRSHQLIIPSLFYVFSRQRGREQRVHEAARHRHMRKHRWCHRAIITSSLIDSDWISEIESESIRSS